MRTSEREQRRARGATEADRQSAALRAQLAAAGHDLQQPLRSLRYLLAALAGEPQGARGSEILASMGHCLDSLEAQLEDLLAVSRLEFGGAAAHLTPVVLDPLFAQLEREFAPQAAERGTRLKRLRTARVVQSDPALLRTALRNLLSNAVRNTARGRILLGCRRRPGHARIAVVDTGTGIESRHQAKVFAPSFQLDAAAEGQGLGLAIVARIAELLDHRVGLRSSPGHGSAFWIDVPELTEEGRRGDRTQ